MKNPIIRIIYISGQFDLPINHDKWSSILYVICLFFSFGATAPSGPGAPHSRCF